MLILLLFLTALTFEVGLVQLPIMSSMYDALRQTSLHLDRI
jgi:hypothetical protein